MGTRTGHSSGVEWRSHTDNGKALNIIHSVADELKAEGTAASACKLGEDNSLTHKWPAPHTCLASLLCPYYYFLLVVGS